MTKNTPLVANVRPAYMAVETGKTYAWCTCGYSRKQPFCDGSHEGKGFSPLMWTADEDKNVFFCTCKLTKTGPLCDGVHKQLAVALRAEADKIIAKDNES